MSDLRTMSPSLSLPFVIGAIRASLGSWGARGWVAALLVHVLHRRLGVICGRLERMLVRFAAGKAMRRGARVVASSGISEVSRPEGVKAPGERLLPREFGWLLRAGKHEVAGCAAHLRLVLEHPDMVALLRASPAAGRLLLPVCRMLGIEAAVLRPVLPGEVVVAVVKVARIRRKVVPVERLPPLVWPRGVLAMSRKYKRLGKW